MRAWVALIALVSFIAFVASGLANLGPSGVLVVRDIPFAVVDLELRGDAIVAVGAIGAIFAVLAVVARGTSEALPSLAAVVADIPVATLNLKLGRGAVLAVGAIGAILAIDTSGGNLVALRVGEPLAVQSPIVGTVVGLGYADRGGVAVSTIGSVGSIGAVVDGDGVGLSKGDRVTYDSPPSKLVPQR